MFPAYHCIGSGIGSVIDSGIGSGSGGTHLFKDPALVYVFIIDISEQRKFMPSTNFN